MNTTRPLLKRLLGLLPIKLIKEKFTQTGSADDVIDHVTGNFSRTAIQDFVFENYQNTKQNIHLFTLDKRFTRSDISRFPYAVQKETALGSVHEICFLPEVTYSVYLSNPMGKQDLEFLLPVVVKVHNKSLVIHFTKLEKKISSYFGNNREAKQASITNDEPEILSKIIAAFAAKYTVTTVDFNKGIKALWHLDDIDCQKIQWRKANSIASEKMDGNLTFKQKYPADYQAIILTPIENTLWKCLLADGSLCDKFATNPTLGTISITQFPIDANQVTNVINKILAGN